MYPLFPSLIAAAFYAGAAAYQGKCLLQRTKPNKPILALIVLIAILFHGGALFLELRETAGLDLEFFNAASLIAYAIIIITLLASLRMPVEILLLPPLLIGALTVLLAQLLPSGTVHPVQQEPGLMAHVLLSILAYGVLTIAAFQALFLLVQDHQLKHKHPSGLIRSFPPLQTMESLLFSFLWAGWGLLTLSLASGAIFLENMFAQHLVHKTFLSCFAWIVFGGLLLGRMRMGWRGHKAVRWTLVGFCLLMLAYFGSKLVREFILHI
ncbi:cytochrome C assembly family protein [Pseudomonas matsuisoli]|uniref:Inner membrane protein YpjD n=1 Tax=Pseudomonas matsuisoli TaxID=1515666 RepID=A0A917PTZ8_9PSED|nr:cytochrome c biogenesis protein CcsA [Pseudomonas matsuisoli]GGJ90989.1 inner membrane protein YpjD [Pseudomonas matsuisoli]